MIDLTTLVLAMVPLWVAIFCGSWALLKFLVFKPLDEMSRDLKHIKKYFSTHQERLTLLEYKVDKLTKEK